VLRTAGAAHGSNLGARRERASGAGLRRSRAEPARATRNASAVSRRRLQPLVIDEARFADEDGGAESIANDFDVIETKTGDAF